MTQALNWFTHPGRRLSSMGYTLVETYPVDLVAGCTGAWATRKVAAAYAGSCLKLRRGSDSTTQDIGFDGYLLDFAAIMSFIGSGDGYVDTWYDQSGNGRNMVQASGVLQPLLVSGGMYYATISDYPQIEFGGSRYLETSVGQDTLITPTVGTIFALWQADAATSSGDGNTIWCNRGGWNGTFIKTIAGTPNIRILGYDGTEDFITTSGYAVATPYITAWQHSAGTLYSFVDGSTAVGSIAHGNETTITAHMCIGRDSQTAGGSNIFDGRIAEVFCWNTALSGADLTTIGSSGIATAYGLSWS